jgi:non-specific serine/threonine protein kinase
MALPYLTKYIYLNGSEEVIRRGKKIFLNGFVELVSHNDLPGNAVFRTRDDSYSIYYKVHVGNFNNPDTLTVRCSCPYNLGNICRHEAAALLYLQEMLDKNMLENKETHYNQEHTQISIKDFDLRLIKRNSAIDSFENAEDFLRSSKVQLDEAANDIVKASIVLEGVKWSVILQRSDDNRLHTKCSCQSEKKHPLCVHKTILLLSIFKTKGSGFFQQIANRDKEKNKLLSIYGYSLADDLSGKFDFSYRSDGKPFLRVLDPSIKRVNAVVADSIVPAIKNETEVAEPIAHVEIKKLKLGLVVHLQTGDWPHFQVDIIKGETNEDQTAFTGLVEKLDMARFINLNDFDEADQNLLQNARKLLSGEIDRYLTRNSPFSGIWDNIVEANSNHQPTEITLLKTEYLYPKLRKLFEDNTENPLFFYLPKGKSFKTKNLNPVLVSDSLVTLRFSVNETKGNYRVKAYCLLGETEYDLAENKSGISILLQFENKLYNWKREDDILTAERFLEHGFIDISSADWPDQLVSFVLPLCKNYDVSFLNVKKQEIKNALPDVRLAVSEKGDYLLFQPEFFYKGNVVLPGDKNRIVLAENGKLTIIHRNETAEQAFFQKIAALHSSFVPYGNHDEALALRGPDILKNNWFFLFTDAMAEMRVPIVGMEHLKKFRFNASRPTTRIEVNHEIDWFDAKVNIHFGDQKVTVADIKKALIAKQQYVPLMDGSLGILPDEWVRKYSILFRMGEGKGAMSLRFSKYHVNIIDELYEQRDDEELFFKLEEKYQRIRHQNTIDKIDPPEHLAPVLRNYQVSGYQWLNYLNKVNWGGILADDMGLGKTIQALSYLSTFKEKKGSLKALVVCPTTLIYNWENEINKFTPSLTKAIHHGPLRMQSGSLYENTDIIITTYGTLRSDIKFLTTIPFDYAILDESQAIKNPVSKTAKAACLLQATHRICMSGTPLQNNTFDIFAQMNFLNPGMLGSVEFFKQEFAVPIDKFNEKEQKEHLRRLLYPFILRRTKEQVAKDLPEKTETILYCEMEEEQRSIYDAWRDNYRDKILSTIESKGINQSQITILQALMKLRQICDSPAILNEKEKYPNVSVKLDELQREIAENIGEHKALVFSQFLGMLALIRSKLIELDIPYAYFDGGTSVNDRDKAIKNFQDNPACRIFLISLKAGGVGLNLTAADYVYIVDPWWNPAVEQQAIDRTHRIGQTKNIFAYRMICKDTIEDKILTLQARKKQLANELVTDDSGFVKSLTKEDIEYLFG